MRQRMMVANGLAFGKDRTGTAGKSARKKDRLTVSDIVRQVLPTAWSSRRSIPHSSEQSDSRLQGSRTVSPVNGELSDEEKISLYYRQFDPYS